MALAYVARFATSAGKLTTYLRRKLRERGWTAPSIHDLRGDDDDPDAAPALSPEAQAAGTAHALDLVARFVALGYVDDAGFARARSGSLLRRGFGARRVDQALGAAGIDADIRAEVRPDEATARAAALSMARKRGFGPYARGPARADPRAARALREKQVAAMLRAGHRMAHVRALLGAGSVADAESWASDTGDETSSSRYDGPATDFDTGAED